MVPQEGDKNTKLSSFRYIPAKISYREEEAKQGLESAKILAAKLDISLVLARILVGRGIVDANEATAFLTPTLKDHLPSPTDIKNIEAAASLVLSAVEANKKIIVFNDFDVDGLSAGSQLVLFLSALGANAQSYTPNRFSEGYGLSDGVVKKLIQLKTELLITVDCGISSVEEIKLAKRHGLQTIIIDHHQPPLELPPADVVVDPAQADCPFQEYQLAAAGLVWMFLIVLRGKLRDSKHSFASLPDPKDFLDLACLGTICDMVPLHKLNRLIAYRGVEALNQTKRPGLIALKEVVGVGAKRPIVSTNVSFGLGPRINAAGRLGDAKQVIELFTTSDSLRAKSIAESIDKLNNQRRGIETEVLDSCLKQIRNDPSILDKQAIAVYGKKYHIGVIGIVAQRLVERFHRPAAVIAPGESVINGELIQVAKGSVRSVPGFHVADALKTFDKLLLTHGGHSQAGGFSLIFDNLEAFQEGFASLGGELLAEEDLRPHKTADVAIDLAEVDFILVEELQKLAPFGVGNPSPLLVTHGVDIVSVTSLSNDHLKLRVSDGVNFINAVAWKFKGHPLIRKGNRVSIAYSPEINSYRGVASVQLNIREVFETVSTN